MSRQSFSIPKNSIGKKPPFNLGFTRTRKYGTALSRGSIISETSLIPESKKTSAVSRMTCETSRNPYKNDICSLKVLYKCHKNLTFKNVS